jgi:hypothetical protein
MRHLVRAYRHKIRPVQQDIRRLQQRISKKTVGVQFFFRKLRLLVLVRRHPLQPSKRRKHAEQKVQLRVLRHMRLHEDRATLRVQPSR